MQTPDRYWEGAFWDGFHPAAIGAVKLTTAKPKDETGRILLASTTQLLTESKRKASEFYVTIFQTGAVASTNKLVVRCWHEAVFLGARAAGVGDPGALNVDFHFNRLSLKFVASHTVDETEAEIETSGVPEYQMTEHLLIVEKPKTDDATTAPAATAATAATTATATATAAAAASLALASAITPPAAVTAATQTAPTIDAAVAASKS